MILDPTNNFALRKRTPLVKKPRKWDYSSKLDHKKLTDNTTFWKIVKPFFIDKEINNEKILLMKEAETISVDKKKLEKPIKRNNFLQIL